MTAAVEMSAGAKSARTSQQARLDEAVTALSENAGRFARMSVKEKVGLIRQSMDGVAKVADAWTEAGSRAKHISPDSGEERIAGPWPTIRNLRLLAQTLERIDGKVPLIPADRVKTRSDGRVEVKVFPTDAIDGALYSGLAMTQLMQPGLTREDVISGMGALYQKKDPEGGVALILGAGNVSSIPPMDALYKMFAEGYVCVVKVNPVNEWVGPHMEEAFRPFIDRGFLRIVYGGADVGEYLVNHDAVVDVHITGSNHTHDRIVWGPPGPDRERRLAANQPLLTKRITSELGNVSPVVIVPHEYSDSELDFMARHVAAMVANNGSFNCNAAKMLVTSSAWSQRKRFLTELMAILAATPTRFAYYPGAKDRYAQLTDGRNGVERVGDTQEGHLPWTLLPGLDSSNASDPAFSTEPFCSMISETSLHASDPAAFLDEATKFMNDTLWGTLNAMIMVAPKTEARPEVAAALDRAIVQLRYGSVTVNHWPGVVYGTVAGAWGGHPSATLANIQSGLGWVHNTYLLEGIEKTVLKGPLKLFPKPLWFADNKKIDAVARRLIDLEHHPSWLKVPGIAVTALQG